MNLGLPEVIVTVAGQVLQFVFLVGGLLAIVVVGVLAAVVGWVLVYWLYAVVLHVVAWTRGPYVLFVYSDSPVWKPYIEKSILPKLPPNAAVLNWSARLRWRRWSLAAMVFRRFAGSREFNPLAVVIRPLHWRETFRFWRAFRDYKHGKPQQLETIETAFFQALKGEADGPAW